jgi:hypothetical protein
MHAESDGHSLILYLQSSWLCSFVTDADLTRGSKDSS